MLSAARGLTDPLACDPVPDLVGPSGFKINGGRVSGLPQGVFVGGDSLPKVEGRGDRFDPETEVRPAPGQPLVPAVGYPQHRVLEVFRIPFDGDAVAFRLVDEGDPRLLWVCDENDLVDLDAEWNPREVDGRPIGAGSGAEILEDSADLEGGGARVDGERPIGVALRGLDARRALVLGKSEDRVEAERQSAVLAHRDRVDELDGAFGAGHAPFNARDRGVPGVVEGEERGVIADLDGRPFEVRGWAVDPLGGARVAVALLFGGGAEGEAGEIAAESVEDRRFREPLPCRRVRGRELRVGPGLEHRGRHRALQLDGRANLPGADLHVHVRLLRHELKTVDKLSGKRPRDAPGRLA